LAAHSIRPPASPVLPDPRTPEAIAVAELELFHADRHTQASSFHVDTNFVFVDCGAIVP